MTSSAAIQRLAKQTHEPAARRAIVRDTPPVRLAHTAQNKLAFSLLQRRELLGFDRCRQKVVGGALRAVRCGCELWFVRRHDSEPLTPIDGSSGRRGGGGELLANALIHRFAGRAHQPVGASLALIHAAGLLLFPKCAEMALSPTFLRGIRCDPVIERTAKCCRRRAGS